MILKDQKFYITNIFKNKIYIFIIFIKFYKQDKY